MSTTYIVAFRDNTKKTFEASGVQVIDGAFHLLNGTGTPIAAFPKEGVSGVYPISAQPDPTAQDVVYTARDYAINHAIIPLIEERDLNPNHFTIMVDKVADEVLVEDDSYDGLQGFRIGVSDGEFAAAVRKAYVNR